VKSTLFIRRGYVGGRLWPCRMIATGRAAVLASRRPDRNLSGIIAADEAHCERSFDMCNGAAFRARAEGRGRPASAGAAGASHAMDEVFRDLRKVVVNYVGDAVHVDTAGCDVGSDQDAIAAVLKPAKGLIALVLAAVAVNGRGLDALIREPSGEPFGTPLCPGEDQERTFLPVQYAMEKLELPILLDLHRGAGLRLRLAS